MDQLRTSGIEVESFSPLDLQFGSFIQRYSGTDDPLIGLSAALASYAVQNGHSCLNLRSYAGSPLRFDNPPVPLTRWPTLDAWIRQLASTEIAGNPGDNKPLILDGVRLYLQRYWRYERFIADQVKKRCGAPLKNPETHRLEAVLNILFPHETREPDWQKVAVAAGMFKKFLVISGGPGTGKTSTIVKLLAATIALTADRPLRFAVAAPTGKAAIRLQEALSSTLPSQLARLSVADAPRIQVSTIHALLKPRPHSPYFFHDRSNPLPLDCVVIDEASMADQALVAKLLGALPEECTVVLVGDKDQLSSVEAGAVLGDLCGREQPDGFSAPLIAASGSVMTAPTGETRNRPRIADSIVILRQSYRFDARSGIGALSRQVNQGDAQEAIKILSSGRYPDLQWWNPSSDSTLPDRLRDLVAQRFGDGLAESDPAAAHEKIRRFRVLCALRKGSFGVETLNGIIERSLFRNGHLAAPGPVYHGKPLLVTRNDYDLDLYNGDTGIAFHTPSEESGITVYFPSSGGMMRGIPYHRLGPTETAFSMTVHKAQGSEFDETLVILPPWPHPLVTRELLYTALTRTRTQCHLWATQDVIAWAIQNRTIRESGLRDAVWGAIDHEPVA